MTDLTPNNLSHLSDDEFNALCPHDGHAPGPEPLSPAAQAVMDAAEPCVAPSECPGLEAAIAAALRAAADQVVPLCNAPKIPFDAKRPTVEWHVWDAIQRARADLLAIVTELENQ